MIVFAWVNDEDTKRAYERSDEAYRVFRRTTGISCWSRHVPKATACSASRHRWRRRSSELTGWDGVLGTRRCAAHALSPGAGAGAFRPKNRVNGGCGVLNAHWCGRKQRGKIGESDTRNAQRWVVPLTSEMPGTTPVLAFRAKKSQPMCLEHNLAMKQNHMIAVFGEPRALRSLNEGVRQV